MHATNDSKRKSKPELKPHRVVDVVAEKIPRQKLAEVPRSYDLVGHVAIVEIPKTLQKYERMIAQAIMQIHKPIRTVAKKTSAMQGRFRVRKLKVIAGEKNTETRYREHGCDMRLDVTQTYFSVRLGHERLRIAERVRPRERVVVFFAGVGPFALVIAKKQPRAQVIGIELNPAAVKYFKENIQLNKLANCEAIRGDVQKLARRYARSADRIVMPLPKDAATFLDAAFLAARNGCTVHFYQFAPVEDPLGEARRKVEKAARKAGATVRFLEGKIVRPYAPHIVQICLDFRIRKRTKRG